MQNKCHQSLEEPKFSIATFVSAFLNDDLVAGFCFMKVDDVLKIPNSQAASFWFKIFQQVT